MSHLKLAARVCAPWEGMQPLPFAIEALKHLGADLVILRAALCDVDAANGPLDSEIISRTIAGIQERAEVAAEVVQQLWALRREPADGREAAQ